MWTWIVNANQLDWKKSHNVCEPIIFCNYRFLSMCARLRLEWFCKVNELLKKCAFTHVKCPTTWERQLVIIKHLDVGSGLYLKQCGEEHDRKRSHQLILALLLNLNINQRGAKRAVRHVCVKNMHEDNMFFVLCALTSLVFLMICCKRMRKFSGSLFTISSRLQRFMDWPAEHISTEETADEDKWRATDLT